MKGQLLPIFLTILTFLGLTFLLYLFLHLLNHFPLQSKIILQLHVTDILVGFTIYIKTAVDFALFIGSLMHKYPGTKNRIAIEIGTSLGNGIGTLVILIIWVFFKEIPILLILMMVIAALVLLRMAEESVEEYQMSNAKYPMANVLARYVLLVLQTFNKFFDPVFGKLLPRVKGKEHINKTFLSLFLFALTIPFLLGLDDFAGYIPLFTVVDVFGFATGVFLGHMLLTASLFAFPQKTTRFVQQPIILLLGGVVFLGLAVLGLSEAGGMILKLLR